MDISRPVLLGSSYSGQVSDLPGRNGGVNEGTARMESVDGDATVKEIIDLLERVSIDGRSGKKFARTYLIV